MTLGEKLNEKRKAKGLTQESVAETLGVTPQAVSKWENNISCPDITLLPQIALLYETTVDELLSHSTPPIAAVVPEEKRKSLDELVLCVRVDDGGDKVRINLPISLIKIFLDAGMSPDVSIGKGNDAIKGIDWNAIMELVEKGVVGRIVEIEEEGGATVVVEVV